jgi:hypothetical protein
MMARLDQKHLVEAVALHYGDGELHALGTYLVDAAELSGKPMCPPHPNGNCRQCGAEIVRDSNAARYCSNRCRQRAYRLRLKGHRRPKKRNKTIVRDTSISAGDNQP